MWAPVALLVALLGFQAQIWRTGADSDPHPEPEVWTYGVVAEYPHDPDAFTQGEFACLLPSALCCHSSTTSSTSLRLCPLDCTGLQFDRTCDNASKACYDIFWESTGVRAVAGGGAPAWRDASRRPPP